MKTFKSQQQSFSYFLFFSLNPTVSIGAKGLLELFTKNVHCVHWWAHMYMPQTPLQLSFTEELFSAKCQSFYYAIVKSEWKEMHGYCCSTKWYAVTSIVNRKPLKKLHGFYYIRTEDSKMQARSEVLKSGGTRLYKSQVWWIIGGIFMIFSLKKLRVHVHPVHPPFLRAWPQDRVF